METNTQGQPTTTTQTQTEPVVAQNNNNSQNNNDQNNNNSGDSGPLDNLDSGQLKDWGRRQAADAAKYRKANAALKAQMDADKNSQLAEQGKFKEMWEASEVKLKHLEGGLQRGMVGSQIKTQLLKLGCNPDLVDKAVKHADIKSIDTDPETYQGNVEQVIFEAKRVKTEVPVFFGNKFVTANDGTPGTVKAPKKSVKDYTQAELDAAYAQALSPT